MDLASGSRLTNTKPPKSSTRMAGMSNSDLSKPSTCEQLGRNDQLAVVAIGPGVIGAHNRLLCLALAAQQGMAAMLADVEKRLELAVLRANDVQALAGKLRRDVVSRLLQLARMTHENP